MESRRRPAALAVLPLALVLAACNTTIKSEQRDGFFVTGEASYEFTPGLEARPPGDLWSRLRGAAAKPAPADDVAPEEERTVRGTVSIDAYTGWVDQSDTQHIDRDDRVSWDNVSFFGPADLDLDYTLMNSRAQARGGVLLWDRVALEAIVGLGVIYLDLQVREPGMEANADRVFVGAAGGGRLTLRPDPMLELRAQWTGTLAPDAAIQDAEFLGVLQLTRHLSVNGGWRWWHLETNRLYDAGSDVDIEISGPTVGAALSF